MSLRESKLSVVMTLLALTACSGEAPLRAKNKGPQDAPSSGEVVDAGLIESRGTPDPGMNTSPTNNPNPSSDSVDAGSSTPTTTTCGVGTDPFSREAMAADLGFLAADAQGGRAPGTAGDKAILARIEERFRCLGLSAPNAGGSFRQGFTTSTGATTSNVIAFIPGTDPVVGSEVIVIGAHHDHLGVRNNQVYNGANDNASGATSVLAIARALKEQNLKPRRTIAFITFGYEEHSGKCEGSEYYVSHTPAALPIGKTVYNINLDMVGTYTQENQINAYGSFTGTAARTALDAKQAAYPGLAFVKNLAAGEDDSDFQAFCNNGVPYLYLETWDEQCYHQPCDDAARIDYAQMGQLAKLTSEIAVSLANSSSNLMAGRGSAASRCELP